MRSSSPSPTPTDADADSDCPIQLTILHHGKPLTYTFPATATTADLSTTIHTTLLIPPTHQKYMITPKTGLLKPPFTSTPLPLATLSSKKITLLGSTPSEITTLNSTIPPRHRAIGTGTGTGTANPILKPATPARHRPSIRQAHDSATYTFHTILPLAYLPNPARSTAFLTRLAADAGIRAAMTAHRFSVGLLTEMDPAAHTTHEGRTLGLNRNQGEVIELRLRTDAYDGYRDYKTIRKTLCHELAHNVFGEHDRDFWELCGRIEGEVERGDWRSGGRSLSDEVFYESGEGGEHVDGGGWSGGEFVLGAGAGTGVGTGTGSAGMGTSGGQLSRRDILARAAEERMRKQRAAEQGHRGDDGPSS